MNYCEAELHSGAFLDAARAAYGIGEWSFKRVGEHDGGRNLVYGCGKAGETSCFLRISYLPDRSREDIAAEVEYIRYLAQNGGSVADVVETRDGKLFHEIEVVGTPCYICLFEKAPGIQIADVGYRYREGVPISVYFNDCGKTLGKLHALSKDYKPLNVRFGFFDKYNEEYISELIPLEYPKLRESMIELICKLRELEMNRDNYGMVHFDFSDGNYMVDYSTGKITVYDFDNARFCWYMFDLANLWTHGVGWIAWERDAVKRRNYMESYFEEILKGYREETDISERELSTLPLFIDAVIMENIIDAFEVMKLQGNEDEDDGELAYKIKCMEEKIPYEGFFSDIYSCDSPFEIPENK